jgi:Flp pilus assembly protein TadD
MKIMTETFDCAAALHLQGLSLCQDGRPAEALACIDRAIGLRPGVGDWHDSRGAALAALGRLDEAIAAFREAMRLDPGASGPLVNLGDALAQAGRAAEALEPYRRAIALDPGCVAAHNNLGNALATLGRLAEAEAPMRAAAALDPGNLAIVGNLATLMHDLGRPADVEALLRQAVATGAQDLASTERLLELARGMALFDLADALVGVVLCHAPEAPDCLYALAMNRFLAHRLKEAEPAFRAVLRRDPSHADAHHALALVLLGLGHYREGWDEFEWRFEARGERRRMPAPPWQGETARGRLLLVTFEQGYGDLIQFCRFVALAARRVRVALVVPPALARLLAGLAGAERILTTGDALPRLDFTCPVLSLPRLLGITERDVPAEVPYLHADPAAVAAWRARLAGLPGLKVGLAWEGNPAFALEDARRVPAERLGLLAGIPGVTLVSLQKEVRHRPPAALGLHDWTGELSDFADTAALMAALDLVISSDTAVVHLAGALARPVWLLSRVACDWRWQGDDEGRRWYPTLRQFRQRRPGDWDEVLTRVRAALATRVA